jgi:EmrB/QacA subfamily drug resistance transporter
VDQLQTSLPATTARAAQVGAGRARTPSRWLILATMTGALSMVMIDQTVVSVALPTMQRDLGLSTTGVQWVVNSYLLLLAVLVAFGGRVADLLGAERTFRAGASVFVLASALCGLAQNETMIILSRGLQGVGAAMMTPSTGSVIVNTFDIRERGKAMGIYSGISMVFLALGPLVGGLLTQSVSWRAVFFINLPTGVAIVTLAHFTLPHRPMTRIPRGAIDWTGVPLLVGGLGALVLGLMQGQTWGWGSPAVIALLAAAVVLIPVFLWWETRASSPLVALRLYREQNFGANSAVLAGVQFALVGASVFGAVWSQQVLGFSAIHAGLAMLPLTLPLLFVAPLAGRAYDRLGPRPLLVTGALLIGAGLAWLGWHLHLREYWWLVPGYIAMGTGIGLTISPGTTDALGAAPARQRSQASGIVQTVRQVGGVIGIAVLGAIVANVAAVGPDATAAAHRTASTNGVAAAYDGRGEAVLVGQSPGDAEGPELAANHRQARRVDVAAGAHRVRNRPHHGLPVRTQNQPVAAQRGLPSRPVEGHPVIAARLCCRARPGPGL